MDLTREVGFLWEEALSIAFSARYAAVHRPGEIRLDGVFMSPDGVGPDPHDLHPLVLEEHKATWRSVRNEITDNWYWIAQSKSYCHGLELSVVVFRVLYLMGDYRGSGPLYRVFRIEYTEEELQENWAMVLNHAKKRGWL